MKNPFTKKAKFKDYALMLDGLKAFEDTNYELVQQYLKKKIA